MSVHGKKRKEKITRDATLSNMSKGMVSLGQECQHSEYLFNKIYGVYRKKLPLYLKFLIIFRNSDLYTR